MARFGSRKILGKEKNIKENDFLIFSFTMKKKSNIMKIPQNFTYFEIF